MNGHMQLGEPDGSHYGQKSILSGWEKGKTDPRRSQNNSHLPNFNVIPDIYHGRADGVRVNFFLASVNFYRFNAKNWHFRQILREKSGVFYRFNAKNWRFWV